MVGVDTEFHGRSNRNSLGRCKHGVGRVCAKYMIGTCALLTLRQRVR